MIHMKVCVFVLFSITSLCDGIRSDNGVLVLTKENFREGLDKNRFLLVEFYAPWCKYCNALAPEYARAAKMLGERDSPVKLAKVDATEEVELKEQYGIHGFPTIKFYINGDPVVYSGGRTAEEIVNWVAQKTGRVTRDLTSVGETKAFIKENKGAVIGFFKDPSSGSAKKFLSAASKIKDYPCGITSADEVFNEYGINGDKVVLFKKYDDNYADDQLNEENIEKDQY